MVINGAVAKATVPFFMSAWDGGRFAVCGRDEWMRNGVRFAVCGRGEWIFSVVTLGEANPTR